MIEKAWPNEAVGLLVSEILRSRVSGSFNQINSCGLLGVYIVKISHDRPLSAAAYSGKLPYKFS